MAYHIILLVATTFFAQGQMMFKPVETYLLEMPLTKSISLRAIKSVDRSINELEYRGIGSFLEESSRFNSLIV